MSNLEFPPFPADEAENWLEEHGAAGDGGSRTLASLYALARGEDESGGQQRQPIGFRVT
jgi:hypothetical protein